MSERPLTPDDVIDAALAIVEKDGVEALTMRNLGRTLGVAVTSIYWHVGGKAEVFDALVERIGAEVGAVDTSGRTPEQRILSIARSLRRNLDARRDLVAVTNQQGRHSVVFVPSRRALAEEFSEAGLRGARLAQAVNAVLHLVVGSVLIERATDRAPAQHQAQPLWDGTPPIDRAAATKLLEPADSDTVFDSAAVALVRGLLDKATASG